MTPSPIVLAQVTKRFGRVTALDDVALTVEPGEFLALAGHNGAGKTTLFKIVLGLLKPTNGNVSVLGGEPGRADALSAIGFLPENVVFTGNTTGRELLRFYASLKHAPRAQCDKLLEQVGLTAAASRRVKTYSKGMRQRLGLAQMLLGQPRLLILDEPTTGLDPESRRHFYELIEQRRAAGATVVLSSHALADFEDKADRIALLKAGRLAACGTLDDLRRDAALPVRIRLHTTEAARAALQKSVAGLADLHPINGQRVEIVCTPERQLQVLKRIGETDAVEHLEIQPPRLEDIYHHIQRSPDEGAS